MGVITRTGSLGDVMKEDGHRAGQRHHRVRVTAGSDDCGDREDGDDRVAPLLEQHLRCEHAHQLQEDQHHRELERDAERGDHQPDQADVLADLEVGLHVGARPRDQELERRAEGPVGDEPTEQEEPDRRQHERDRVLLLLGVQGRHDEPPQLPHQHRQRQDDAAVGGDRQPSGEAFQRPDELQLAAVVPVLAHAQIGVGLAQELEHLVVGRQDDDDAHDDGEHGPDDASAQLGQVLRERHAVVGRLDLRPIRIAAEGHLHSLASPWAGLAAGGSSPPAASLPGAAGDSSLRAMRAWRRGLAEPKLRPGSRTIGGVVRGAISLTAVLPGVGAGSGVAGGDVMPSMSNLTASRTALAGTRASVRRAPGGTRPGSHWPSS